MGHSLFLETKEGEGDTGEESGEGRSAGEGVGSLRFSFQTGFYGVTSNADLPPTPLLSRSIRPSICASLLFLTIVYGQVDSNWLFFHEADFSSPPHPNRKGPFSCLSEVSVYVCVCVVKYARHLGIRWF